MKFSKEVTEHLLNGGKIIDFKRNKDTGLHYVLIRMPKDKFVTYDGTDFEYLECHNNPLYYKKVGVMTYRNGTIRQVKGRFEKEYFDDLIHLKNQIKREIKNS